MSDAASLVLHRRAGAPPASESGPDRTLALCLVGSGVALFALMGVLGLLMRLTQADVIGIPPDWFYRIMTLHGAGMLTGALVAMMGGLWFVLRADVGLSTSRMVASLAAMLTGAACVVVAVLIGGFAAGWTFLWPLPFDSAGQWSTWATVVFLAGIMLVGIAFLVFCIDVLERTTTTYGGLARTLGLRLLVGRDADPPPPQVIGATVVAIIGIINSAIGTTAVAALLVRAFDDQAQIDALWAKNVTYFFGHTLANLIIYLAAGVVYVLLPRYAGRAWKTTVPIVVGWMATLVLVLTVYSHHLYMDAVQPRAMQYISSFGSFASAIPVAVVTIFTGMMLVWGSGYRWTLASRLLYLGFAGWTIGGAAAVIDSIVPVNSRLHNTLWVPGHFHTYLLLGVMFWAFAFLAHVLERAAGRPAGRRASWLATGLMVVGGYGLMAMWIVSGALGLPRRYAVHPAGTSGYSLAASICAMVFAVGFLVLLYELAALGATALERRAARAGPAPVPEAESALERWTAFRGRLRSGGAPLASPAAVPEVALARAAALRAPLARPLVTPQQLAAALAAAVVFLAAFAPSLTDATEADPSFHHLQHAGQFLFGALLGLIVASLPRVSFPRSDATVLGLAILAPLGMLLMMAPSAYGSIDGHPALHALYHVGVAALGFLTALGCARLTRVTGGLLLITSVGMAVLFAPGVSGG